MQRICMIWPSCSLSQNVYFTQPC